MERNRRGRKLRKFLVVSLLCFGVLEAGYRVYLFNFADAAQFSKYAPFAEVPADRLFYRGHHYLDYCLNEAYRSPDGKNRHNSLGYRGKEITRAKSPGVYRIACIGGSTTYETLIADYQLSYPDQLEAILREQYGAREVEVINAGCGGWTSWESLIDLEFRLLDLAPDLIVVYHGTNDVHPRLIPPEAYRSDNSGYRRQWCTDESFWERSAVLRLIGIRLGWAHKTSVGSLTVREYDDSDRAEWLAANPPTFFKANLENTIALARAHGIGVVLATWAWCPERGDYAANPVYQQGFRQGNDVVRDVAARNGIELYDFVEEMPTDPEFWGDGRHVNERGARRKAELFASFIAPRFLGREGR